MLKKALESLISDSKPGFLAGFLFPTYYIQIKCFLNKLIVSIDYAVESQEW